MSEDEEPRPGAGTYNVSGKPWGIAEGERIFLSIRPNEDGRLVLRGFDYTFVPNASNPEAKEPRRRRGRTSGA